MSVYVKDLDFCKFYDAIAVVNLVATKDGVAIAPGANTGNLLSTPIYPRIAETYLGFELKFESQYISIAIEKQGNKYQFNSVSKTWAIAPEIVYYTIQEIKNSISFWLTQGNAEIQFRIRLQRDAEGRSPHLTCLQVAYTYSGDLIVYLLTIALPKLLQISVTLMRDVQVMADPNNSTVSLAPAVPGFDLGKLQNIKARSRLGGALVPCTIKGNKIEISKAFPTHLPAGLLFDYSPLVEYIGQSTYQVREIPCIVISDPNEQSNFKNASHLTSAIASGENYLELFQSYSYNKTLEIKIVAKEEADANLIASHLIAIIKKKGFIDASAIDKKIPLAIKSGVISPAGNQIKGELCVKSFDLTLINLLAGTS